MKIIFFLFFIFISGCAAQSDMKVIPAVYNKSVFSVYQIQALPFILTTYERMLKKTGVVRVYIEGDGQAWLTKKRPSLDPTPKNPLAFKLAQLDPTENIIYLARPCQYTKAVDGIACDSKYWTSHRFAPNVVEAMNNALNDIKYRHNIKAFNLIGYSGGGNIAALLTAKRNDVSALITVAGNLNHELQSEIHNVSLMPYSLNAIDVANEIKHIPQFHYVGREDKIVPPVIADSYLSASDNSNKVQVIYMPKVSHQKGWQKLWPNLLASTNFQIRE